jgi:preprotein translocase subunit SecE
MARLLRKRTVSSKKKSKQESEAPAASKDSVTGSLKAVFSPEPSPEAKKIQALQPKKPLIGTKPAAEKESDSFYQKALQFLREVKIELKKVTWPSRKQTVGSTVVVIILVMIISLFLGVVDVGLSTIIRVVLQ